MNSAKVPFQAAHTMLPVSLPKYKQPAFQVPQSVSILIGGSAGAGIKTLEKLLSTAFKKSGYFVFSTKEYMSRVRGGSNTTLLRIADAPLNAPCWSVDLAIVLNKDALQHIAQRVTDRTIVLADESITDAQITITAIPMIQTAKSLSDIRYANSYVAGVLFGLLRFDQKVLLESIDALFHANNHVQNEIAAQEGNAYSKNLHHLMLPNLPAPTLSDNMHLIDGSAAAGFGFLAGGCDMITAYPMSPSTGVINFLASISREFTVLVEQSEDEIASLNMVLGGWFGGARAMTSTSGGGFALMSEAISLSGMSETPAVIYLAQRPGPATGLPTRSEQGDLNLAIHSGHGEFGRIVLAPGDLLECIDYGYLAFELADRYQMPVIYLSDQYLADSIGMVESIDFSAYEQRRYIKPTDAAYNRYSLNDTGITPRGIPGLGEGIIISTSDEHDQRGQITESYQMREQMVSKRQKKTAYATAEAHPPYISREGTIAVIGWGSTKGAVAEAIKVLNDERLFQVHFVWIHPLNPDNLEILKETKTNIIVENNASGQFADLLQHHQIKIDYRILQANGFAFFTDQLTEKLTQVLEELT